MAKLIKILSSKCILLLVVIAVTFCVSIAFNVGMAFAEENELPQDRLLIKGATEEVPWEYGYINQDNWQAYDPYKQGTPLDRLSNYNGSTGDLLAWTTTIEDFKACGRLTKISIIKTEDGSELVSCTAADPENGIQMSDFPSEDVNWLVPECDDYDWSFDEYNGICFNNVVIKNTAGDRWNMRPWVRDINTYVSIQGTLGGIIEDTNYDFTVILYFNDAENIPPEVLAVIDAIDAIGEVTVDNYSDPDIVDSIKAARKAYDELESQDYKDKVSNYTDLTDAEAAVESFKLDSAKASAKGDLDALLTDKTESDYDVEDWTALNAEINSGKEAIDAATTIVEVNRAKNAAENAVSAIKTKEQKAAEELEGAKTSAKDYLDALLTGKTESDYDAQDWIALNAAINSGKEEIDAATTIEEVNTAKSAAESAVSAIKTKEQKAAEKADKIKKQKAAAKKYTVKGLKVKVKSRKFTISWKKTAGATGYQVQYKLKSAKKYKTLKTLKKLKVTSKKLKKGKTYQFKVRTYTIIDGAKTYGKWTKVKAAKCR